MSETSQQAKLIAAAEKAMGIEVQHELYVDQPEDGGGHKHCHVAVAWEGGVIWLDMSVQHDHYCVDVRQFVPDPVRKDQSKIYKHHELTYSADGRPVNAGASGTLNDSPHGVCLAGQGVFTIVNGRRQSLRSGGMDEDMETGELRPDPTPLDDPDGTPVRGHGWNGGYVVILMHDKQPGERQTNRPAGPGRG